MLSTPLICCSMGVATDCSTVCASAPTYVVCTCTSGGAIAGNCETGRLTMVMAPTMTVRSEITIATIGRLMKKRDTLASRLRGPVGGDVDGCTVPYLQLALDNHAFAGFQAVGHDPELPDAVANRDRTDRHLAVRAHHRDLVTALQLGDRALRNQQGAGCRPCGETDASVSAGPKKIVGIGKDAGDADRPGRRVDFANGEGDLSGVFVDAPIPEHQLKRDPFPLFLDPPLGRKAPVELHEDLLAHGEVSLDGIDLRNRREDGAGSDEVSDLHARDTGDSTDQRSHFRELQVEFGLLDVRLCRQDRGLGTELRLEFRIELALGDGARLGQRPVALDIEIGLAKLRLRLGQLGFCLIEGRPQGPRIDLEQHVAFADGRAFPVVLLDDVAGDSRLDFRVDVSVQRGHPLGVDGRVTLNDGGDLYSQRLSWRRGLAAAAPAEDQEESPEQRLKWLHDSPRKMKPDPLPRIYQTKVSIRDQPDRYQSLMDDEIRAGHRSEERRVGKECRSRWA